MSPYFSILPVSLFASVSLASATIRYVDVNSPTPTPPYTNWETAATTIQAAVDVAVTGDEILVTNGVYAVGGRAVTATMTNRVVVMKPVTVRSVNGPAYTIIQGYQVPGTTNGNNAIRCVYLAAGAVLSGFTLTNGATRTVEDYYTQACGGGVYGGTTDAVATNCVLTGNSAYYYGGGAYRVKLFNCTVTGNSACGATGAYGIGGGAYAGTLVNCTVAGNSANIGGGVYNGLLYNCQVTGNSALINGGGVSGGTLANCTVTGNSAKYGGGAADATLMNCILAFNTAARQGTNWLACNLSYCCTTPLPSSGAGNIDQDPQLASAVHLSAASPCRGAGLSARSGDTDIDGEAWQSPASIGCDEYNVGAVTGSLQVGIRSAHTNAAVGFAIELTAMIEGRTSASVWDFGDGVVVSNRPYASHAWTAAGTYPVVLTAYNESLPMGVSTSLTVQVGPVPIHYVAAGSTNPVPPYASWATAAGDIQSAVDAADVPGALVLVNDGLYDTGGRVVSGAMTNRLVVDKEITVQSVNGPETTTIQGYQVPGTTNGNSAIRCVYLASGSVLSGFKLSKGATRTLGETYRELSGGGAWCASMSALVTNCVLTGNTAGQNGGGSSCGTLSHCTLAANGAMSGGGAEEGTLDHCVLSGNSASQGGGAYKGWLSDCILTNNRATSDGAGVHSAWLVNCTLTGNSSANNGGGASYGTLNNCIVYFNTANAAGTANYRLGTLNYCCTAPLPAGGTCNFTNEPLFVDIAGGDFHLQNNSPCINAGRSGDVASNTDLDGNPRIAGSTVDAGAFEFQTPLATPSYAWLQSYGLPTDGSADYVDSDSDGMNNWQEWIAGTNPTNATSALKLLTVSAALPSVALTWQSVSNRTYFVERAASCTTKPSFDAVATSVPGGFPTTAFIDTNAPASGPVLYRVGTQLP